MTPEPEWVDLGLPSGLLWARQNIGANRPEETGLFFSWGNTEGHVQGSGFDFSQNVYDESPAASISSDLSLSDDMARANLGEPWRLPSHLDYKELVDNCVSIWTTLNGVYGRRFTSRINGETIFLPAAGVYNGTILQYVGIYGRYWTSSYVSTQEAYDLFLASSTVDSNSSNGRRLGFTCRAVMQGTPNRSVVPSTPEDEPKDEETPTMEEPKDENQH